MRPLAEHERQLIQLFAAHLDDNRRQQLLADLSNASIAEERAGGACLVFHIEGYIRPPYRGQHTFPVEAETGPDSAKVSILLYADQNDRLLELEYIDWTDGREVDTSWKGLRIKRSPF